MIKKILMRASFSDEGELEGAQKNFDVISYRTQVDRGDLVIPRYSSLPYYQELEKDIENLGGTLIQSFQQHRWIADFLYYKELADYTFPTWEEKDFYLAPEGEYVVKGKTNSRKWRWSTEMYGSTKSRAVKIAGTLYGDSMIGSQGIIFRKYIPLKSVEKGINGVNFSNEYRFFFLGETLIGGSYYWACAEDPPMEIPQEAVHFAHEVAGIAKKFTNFFVIDVAEKEEGGYILVELNCGTMSGLSLIEPENFYKKLRQVVD